MTHKDYKIKAKTSWIGTQSFQVVEIEFESFKPFKIVNEDILFTGDILQCEAYLRLLNGKHIL